MVHVNLYFRYHIFNKRRLLYTPRQEVQMRNTQNIKGGRKEGHISFDLSLDIAISEFKKLTFPLHYHTIYYVQVPISFL